MVFLTQNRKVRLICSIVISKSSSGLETILKVAMNLEILLAFKYTGSEFNIRNGGLQWVTRSHFFNFRKAITF